MDWFAINDIELRQFHMAGLVAGGGNFVLPVVNGIRDRKISYITEAEKPTANTGSPKLPPEIIESNEPCDYCVDGRCANCADRRTEYFPSCFKGRQLRAGA